MEKPNLKLSGKHAKQAYEIKRLWENIVNTQIEGTRARAQWSDHWAFAKSNMTLYFAPTENIDQGIALCIHEAGHLDSDYDLIPKAKAVGSLMVFCNNIIEDILVENLQCKRMDGADRLLREETNAYTAKNRKRFEADPMWRKRGLACYTIARGYDTVGSFPEIEPIAKMANKLKSSGTASYAVAKALYDIIREKQVEEQKPKPEKSEDKKPEKQKPEKQKPQDDDDDEQGTGTGESDDNQQSGEPDEESEGTGSGSGEPENDDEESEGTGSGKSDEESPEKAEAKPEGTEPDDDDNEAEAEPIDGTDKDDQTDPFQKPSEESEQAPDPIADAEATEAILEALDDEVDGYGEPSTGIWEGIQEEADKGIDKVTLGFVDSRTMPVKWMRPEQFFSYADHAWNPDDMSDAVKSAYMKLQRILIDADEIQRKKGLKRGKLNGKALHRLQADNDRVFSKRLRGIGVRQFAFSIIVDESSSMSGHKNIEARKSAHIICETLDKLHIPFNLTGFLYSNSNEIINLNYKGFDESWANRKQSLRHMKAHGSNMDCHSITECYKLIEEYPATHRVMIVISDGQPCPENPSILRETVPLWERKVKVIGIGLDYGQIKRFYNNSVATTANDLPFKLAKLMQEVIFTA